MADHLLALCFTLVMGSSALTGAACLLWGRSFCLATKVPQLTPYLWLLPLSLAAAGAAEALNYYTIRRKDYARMAKARLGQNGGQAAVQVGLGLGPAGSLSLLVGETLGRVLGVLPMLRGGWVKAWWGSLSCSGLRQVARIYARFPKYMAGATLLNIAALQAPFLLIPSLFGAEEAGNYFLAYRVLVLPSSLIGGAVAQIFLGEAACLGGDAEKLRHQVASLFLALATAYLPLYLAIGMGGPALFQVVFGDKWLYAGLYVQILAPMVLVWGIASPISSVLVIRDRLGESLVFTVLELGTKLGAIYLGARKGSILLAVILLAAIGFLVSVLAAWRFLRAAGVTFRTLGLPLLRLTGAVAPMALLIFAAQALLRPWVALPVSVAALAATYVWLVRRWRQGGVL